MTIRTVDLAAAHWAQQLHATHREAPRPQEQLATQAREAARTAAGILKHEYGAQRVVLFGSLTRDTFDAHSDIDIGVSGIEPTRFYRAVAHVTETEEAFDLDILDLDACPQKLREHIIRHGVAL